MRNDCVKVERFVMTELQPGCTHVMIHAVSKVLDLIHKIIRRLDDALWTAPTKQEHFSGGNVFGSDRKTRFQQSWAASFLRFCPACIVDFCVNVFHNWVQICNTFAKSHKIESAFTSEICERYQKCLGRAVDRRDLRQSVRSDEELN